jgi:outer membrane protein assembly factor BamB
MVIVAVGGKQHGVVAFDRATGTQVWASAACGALTHSSPGLVRIGGVDQVVLACAKGMVGINAADGTDLWRWNDWHPKMAIPSPTLVGDDCLFIVEGYGGGCGMCRITSSNGTFRAETVFTNTACNGQIPTAVYRDGYIYSSGNSNNKNDGLMCLDLRGNVKWKTGVKPKFERGNLLLADDLLFMLDGSSGMLRLIAPQPDRYVQLAEANVTSGAKGQIWGPLALADGRLYVRGHAELVCLDVSAPSDWPWWRGPYRNGISLETDWEPAALSNKSNVVWQSNVGNGHSAVAISGARLYTMGNRNNRDIVVCLDVATGTQLWRVSYSCPAGDYPGPRSTPVVDDMRVYTLSRDGQAYCLDALTGNVLWHTNLTTAFGAQAPTWGMASSAVVFGPYVLYNAGSHGIMLDKRTGVSIWSSPAGIGNYNTPVLHVGTKTMTAFFFNKSSLCCVDVATGKLLWSFPWETRYDIMAADPLPIGDAVFISSAYDKGAALVAAKNSKPKTVWQNKNMCNHFSTCVLIDGHLYGISGNTGNGALVCLDPTTGAKKWRQPGGFEALTAAGDKLICVTLKGEAVVVRATPTAYMEAARCAVLPLPRRDTKCWTMPVLNRGRIFFRNSVGDLLCVDVSK